MGNPQDTAHVIEMCARACREYELPTRNGDTPDRDATFAEIARRFGKDPFEHTPPSESKHAQRADGDEERQLLTPIARPLAPMEHDQSDARRSFAGGEHGRNDRQSNDKPKTTASQYRRMTPSEHRLRQLLKRLSAMRTGPGVGAGLVPPVPPPQAVHHGRLVEVRQRDEVVGVAGGLLPVRVRREGTVLVVVVVPMEVGPEDGPGHDGLPRHVERPPVARALRVVHLEAEAPRPVEGAGGPPGGGGR